MAMLTQWQQSNSNEFYQFLITQIKNYGQAILGDRE
jgi:hypothetical protein